MARKVIITCAVTGSADTVAKNPAVPVTPAEIAHSALDAARAGAAIVHVHVRNPETGKASMALDHYRETAGLIRQSETDVVLNLTTGYGARLSAGVYSAASASGRAQRRSKAQTSSKPMSACISGSEIIGASTLAVEPSRLRDANALRIAPAAGSMPMAG